MELNETFGMMLFFSLFAVLGGAGVGAGLRQLLRRNMSGLFFLVWGAGFGGIPLVIGAATFLPQAKPIYFYTQLFMFIMPMIVVTLLPDEPLDASRDLGVAIGGAIMIMLGGMIILFTMQNGVGIFLVAGGFIALLGAAFLIYAALGVLRGL